MDYITANVYYGSQTRYGACNDLFIELHVCTLTGNSPRTADGSLDDVCGRYVYPIVTFPAGPAHELIHPLAGGSLDLPEK